MCEASPRSGSAVCDLDQSAWDPRCAARAYPVVSTATRLSERRRHRSRKNRHARPCAGHPPRRATKAVAKRNRASPLPRLAAAATWMRGTSPGMTIVGWGARNLSAAAPAGRCNAPAHPRPGARRKAGTGNQAAAYRRRPIARPGGDGLPPSRRGADRMSPKGIGFLEFQWHSCRRFRPEAQPCRCPQRDPSILQPPQSPPLLVLCQYDNHMP